MPKKDDVYKVLKDATKRLATESEKQDKIGKAINKLRAERKAMSTDYAFAIADVAAAEKAISNLNGSSDVQVVDVGPATESNE